MGELRAQMSYSEFMGWLAYIDKNGPLSPTLRMDAAIARLAMTMTKGATMKDFMPWPKEPEVEATPEAVFALIKSKWQPKPDANAGKAGKQAKVQPAKRSA